MCQQGRLVHVSTSSANKTRNIVDSGPLYTKHDVGTQLSAIEMI